MATINYTVERDVAGGSVKVEWAGLAGGDVGQSFYSAGLRLGSIQYSGNFNGNMCVFEVSNEVVATNFTTINSRNTAGVEVAEGSIAALFGAGRPSLNGSGGSITVAALFVKA